MIQLSQVKGTGAKGFFPNEPLIPHLPLVARGKSTLGKPDLIWELPHLVSPTRDLCQSCQKIQRQKNVFSLYLLHTVLPVYDLL